MLDTWALDEGLTDMEGMVSMHLSTNFYPPFPTDFVEQVTPLLAEAIENCQNEDGDVLMAWPDVQPQPAPNRSRVIGETLFVEARVLVDMCKAWPLV